MKNKKTLVYSFHEAIDIFRKIDNARNNNIKEAYR